MSNVKSTPKSKKLKNATKTPKHKISQNNEYQPITLVVFCVLAPKTFGVVAKKRLFGVGSSFDIQNLKFISENYFLTATINRL